MLAAQAAGISSTSKQYGRHHCLNDPEVYECRIVSCQTTRFLLSKLSFSLSLSLSLSLCLSRTLSLSLVLYLFLSLSVFSTFLRLSYFLFYLFNPFIV